MTKDEEAQIRCSKEDLESVDYLRCENICHKNCLGNIFAIVQEYNFYLIIFFWINKRLF